MKIFKARKRAQKKKEKLMKKSSEKRNNCRTLKKVDIPSW